MKAFFHSINFARARFLGFLLGGMTLVAQTTLFSQTITQAFDSGAGYSGGWVSGSNAGTGFQPWNIWTSGGTGGFGGNFVGNPADGGITGMATNSFGLYANPIGSGASANAERTLNTALAIGQTLSLQWGINFDSGSGGNKGFNLYSGGAEIFNINNAGSSAITCNGANVGFGYGSTVMTWSFTRVDSTTVRVSANDRDGVGTFATNVVVSNGAIDKLRFYASGMQSGDAAQPYFNNLTVTEPVASSMAVPGDHAFLGPWQPDGSNGTGMTQSSNPATPNLWTSYFKSSDARLISFKFVANGTFDFAWGADPGRAGYAKRGGDSIKLIVPATGLYKFNFNQSTLQYSLTRAGSADFGSYSVFSATYSLTGDESSDEDGDGLTNGQEYILNTDPTNPDSDADTLTDREEVNTSSTNPLLADSDTDGLPDWWEVGKGLNPNSSVGNNGALGDPDADSFTNKVEFEGQSDPLSAVSVPANRAVTFTVDLNRQIAAGSFLTNNSAVEVWGTFNDWGNFTNKFSLTNNGSGTYSGTYAVPGAAGATNLYKFVTFNSNNTLSWEPGNDRLLVMGDAGVATNLPVAHLGEVRPVIFSVNMGVQVALGRFLHGTNKVFVAGTDVNGGWDPGTELARVGSTDVYSGTVFVSNVEGMNSAYKFRVDNALAYEGDVNPDPAVDTRIFTLGARDLPQTNAEVFFNNVTNVPANRTVTFAVNMNVQTNTNKLSFNPATDTVEVRGDFNNFGGGSLWRLTNNGSGIFTGSFVLEGAEGQTNNYKYVALIASNTNTTTVWERVDFPRTNANINRAFTLGPTNTTQTVHSLASPAFFSLDDGVGPVITLKGANPLNLNLGEAFVDPGATVVDTVEGAGADITGAGTVNTALTGSYTLTYNVSDAAGNAATPVTRTVVVAGSSFAGWSGGATLNETNLAKYAMGGASSLTANDGQASVVGGDATTLTLTAVVRTDDSTVAITGEASTDLSSGWSSTGVSVSNASSQAGVPQGCTRKVFSVSRGTDDKKFIRIKATK